MTRNIECRRVNRHSESGIDRFLTRRIRGRPSRRREWYRGRRENIDTGQSFIIAGGEQACEILRTAVIAAAISATHIFSDKHAELYTVGELIALMPPHRLTLHGRRQVNAAWAETKAIAVEHGRQTALRS